MFSNAINQNILIKLILIYSKTTKLYLTEHNGHLPLLHLKVR